MLYVKAYDAKSTVEDDPKGVVHLVVSCYGVEDSDGDTMLPGAFMKSIGRLKSGAYAPVGLAYHKLDRPCAKTLDAFEDGDTVHVVGQFNLDIKDGQEVFSNIKKGVITKYSHGFVSPVFNRKGFGKRDIADLDWKEWSPVAVPALGATYTVGVKGISPDGMPFADQSEAVLAAVEDLTARAREIHAMRQKSGRTLSRESRALIQKLSERLQELLAETFEPTQEDLQREIARFIRTQHAFRGLSDA